MDTRLPLVPVRPAAAQVQKRHRFRANQTFQPLPPPSGTYPYRLSLEDVVGKDAIEEVRRRGELVFHVVGDTGGVKHPEPQQIVAIHLENEFANGQAPPSFLYHLGDVVYFNGERPEYYPQFYEPYMNYPAPILAIPGNHDGDPLNPLVEASLSAFVETFCSVQPHLTPEAEEVDRETMIEPNVYWTLRAPFVTIVGLYTNVPEGGRIDSEQSAWLGEELADAPQDAALIVALHHPPYSADAHHGGSEQMGEALDAAFESAARRPDLVLSAHVHNYQRFSRTVGNRKLPYIVAGAGGYWHLHYMARGEDGNRLEPPWQVPDADVILESFADDRHGFLRLRVSAKGIRGEYVSVPRPQESWRDGPVETVDQFEIVRAR